MEIGSHGLTHEYLTTMAPREAIREIRESKASIEQTLGLEVTSFAPVGGHFRRWMVEEAVEFTGHVGLRPSEFGRGPVGAHAPVSGVESGQPPNGVLDGRRRRG